MKNKLLLGLTTTLVLLSSTNAFAKSATVEFTGKDTVSVGDTFTVKMNVNNVLDTEDGIVSLDGNLTFDKNMVEYVSSTSENAPYYFDINESANYRMAGLDFTLENGIKQNATIYEFTFKALQAGNTEITLNNYKLTDTKGYVDTNIVAKNINIESKIVKVSNKVNKNSKYEKLLKTITNMIKNFKKNINK